MKASFITFGRLIIVLLMAGMLCLSGCKGSESREKVDDAVETMSGKEQVEQMDKMKEDFIKAQQKSEERIKSQLEDDAK